jgi:hypothetical protein
MYICTTYYTSQFHHHGKNLLRNLQQIGIKKRVKLCQAKSKASGRWQSWPKRIYTWHFADGSRVAWLKFQLFSLPTSPSPVAPLVTWSPGHTGHIAHNKLIPRTTLARGKKSRWQN